MSNVMKAPTQKSIGQLIRSVRKSVGMTQVGLAKHMQVSQGTLSKLENGLLVPSVIEWYRLCEATKLSYDAIVSFEPKIPSKEGTRSGLETAASSAPIKYSTTAALPESH